jgi:hypothetical protein
MQHVQQPVQQQQQVQPQGPEGHDLIDLHTAFGGADVADEHWQMHSGPGLTPDSLHVQCQQLPQQYQYQPQQAAGPAVHQLRSEVRVPTPPAVLYGAPMSQADRIYKLNVLR